MTSHHVHNCNMSINNHCTGNNLQFKYKCMHELTTSMYAYACIVLAGSFNRRALQYSSTCIYISIKGAGTQAHALHALAIAIASCTHTMYHGHTDDTPTLYKTTMQIDQYSSSESKKGGGSGVYRSSRSRRRSTALRANQASSDQHSHYSRQLL